MRTELPSDHRALPCPGCGYDTTGLNQNRCPECGKEFDPQQIRRTVAGLREPMSMRGSVKLFLAVPSVAAGLDVATCISGNSGLLFLTFIVCFVGGVISSVVLVKRSIQPRWELRSGRPSQAVDLMLLVLIALGCCVLQGAPILAFHSAFLYVFYAYGGRLPFDH